MLSLILLLCGDFAFFILHFINSFTPALNNPYFNISRETSYPEIYQYIKFLLVVILLIRISFKNRTPHYAQWALVFAYFLFDDYLQIHERIGRGIAENVAFMHPFGLSLQSFGGLQDFGELAVSAIVGIILFTPLAWTYRSGSRMFQKVSQDFILLIVVLVFFAIAVDMTTETLALGPGSRFILEFIEDGGEMLTASFMLWYAFSIKARDDSDNAGCRINTVPPHENRSALST